MKQRLLLRLAIACAGVMLLTSAIQAVEEEQPAPPPAEEKGEDQPSREDDPDPQSDELHATNGLSEHLQEPLEAESPQSEAHDSATAEVSSPVAPAMAQPAPSTTPLNKAVDNAPPRDRGGSRERPTRPENHNAPPSSSDSVSNFTPNTPAPVDFSAFKIIGERNIFDPNRSPRRERETTSRPRSKTVESFKLVGVMSYEKGRFAFFEGSSSQFTKALKFSDEIAGFSVAEISQNAVKLVNGDQQVELKVGSQMRREESGPWEKAQGEIVNELTAKPSSESPASSTSTQAGAQPDNDVLKRLMERREQE